MGQTDAQFKAFIRFVLDAMEAAVNEEDEKKKEQMFQKILDNLQKTLED